MTGGEGATEERLAVLLEASLALWSVAGAVRREAPGKLIVEAGGRKLAILRAPADLPFRWLMECEDRQRGVSSVTGLLRALRAELDQGWRPAKVRIIPLRG